MKKFVHTKLPILYSVGQFACRKLCKVNIKTGGGCTKGLHTHLHAKHDISVLKQEDDGSGEYYCCYYY